MLSKDTGLPIFEYNCTGSTKALDLSSDGTRCIVGGKAVHARISGHGGRLYYFDTFVAGIDEDNNNFCDDYSLEQNYPNPFNPTTNISYYLPKASNVTINIYNITGQLIKTLISGKVSSGTHTVNWKGDNNMGRQVASGVYIYSLQTEAGNITKKMILVK